MSRRTTNNDSKIIRDLGFDTKVMRESTLRLLNRDGTFNISRGGLPRYCQLKVIRTSQPIGGFIPLLSGHDLGARRFLPCTKCPRTKFAIVNRSRQMPTQPEQIAYYTINCKKALSLSS